MKFLKPHIVLFLFGLMFIALCGVLNEMNYGSMAVSAGFIAAILEIASIIKYLEV